MCGGAYSNSPTVFQMLPHIQLPLPQDWGFAIPTQNCNLAFRQNCRVVGKFAQLRTYVSTVGSNSVAQKNYLLT